MTALSEHVTPILNGENIRLIAMLETALGPLIPYLDDPAVVELMSNPDGRLWIERAGQTIALSEHRLARESAENIIRLLATHANTVVDYQNPSLTCTLPKWGCRVQADVPPLVAGPSLTIRKPAKRIYTMADYVKGEIMSQRQCDIIYDAVAAHKNIIISGGTGSGKTTLTNALLDLLSNSSERIIMIEDNRELQCSAPNLYALYTYGHYPLSRAIADSLRRRPDRIIVGEVRDAAALDMLKAWNTGHPGGIATLHANDERLTLDRLCEMIEELNGTSNRAFVARSVDLIVHVTRDLRAKTNRRVSGIVEVENGLKDNNWWFRVVD